MYGELDEEDTNSMNDTMRDMGATFDQTIVASYGTHADAESAIRSLVADGFPVQTISILGRNFEAHQDVHGFYHPADAAVSGAGQGAWAGGIFALMLGAFGFFILPVVGPLVVLGPIAGMIAAGATGVGVGVLVNALISAGLSKELALKYQDRLQAGEFIIVVKVGAREAARAHQILGSSEISGLNK